VRALCLFLVVMTVAAASANGVPARPDVERVRNPPHAGNAGPSAAQGLGAGSDRSLAPFVASPPDVVDRMLTLADVGPEDVVYDLGCGDGRIVIAAALKFGARGVGVDIDPRLINQAEANARAAGVQNRVRFRIEDAMKVDVSDATVVTLYLLSASNVRLRPILTKQLRTGARIVSHSFAIGDWEPDVVDTFRDAAGTSRTLYLWNFDGVYRP
jgi:SAM-dependent methyltransferase